MKYIDYNEGEHHKIKKNALEWYLLTLTATLFYGLLLTERGNFK